MPRSCFALSSGTITVSGLIILALSGPAIAQTGTHSATAQQQPVRAMTIQEARREAQQVLRPGTTQEALRQRGFEPYGTRVQRQRRADKKAKKCANALKRLQAAYPSEDISEKPVPFACR